MSLADYPSSHAQAERAIAAARVALAISSLFAVWLDPAEPERYAQVTYGLYWGYVVYSLLTALVTWQRPQARWLPLTTHIVDIVSFSIFQYLTLGPSSPFFLYFLFSLFCGAIRWGWRGTLATASVVVTAYLVMGSSMSRTLGASEFELNRFVVRVVYLGVAAGLLVYLGRYEARLREEIERLARWPVATEQNGTNGIADVVAHAARILGANRLAITWETSDEPWTNELSWSAEAGVSLTKRPPAEDEPPYLPPGFDVATTTSAPFATARIEGRVFFVPAGTPTDEIGALSEVVAREIGASLDQLHVSQQLRQVAASEERIRVARNLHDGVLQSLTGIRLELRALAGIDAHPDATRDRLFAIERALAIEQRELRLFISGLKPAAADLEGGSLASRLDELRERIALEWKAPVTIRLSPGGGRLPERIEDEVPLMVHEAVVNALKHAQPSRVTVAVDTAAGELRIVVSDDGRGFPVKGHYDHAALAASMDRPRSLFDRVSALGGRMDIESSDAGSRVEMVLSL